MVELALALAFMVGLVFVDSTGLSPFLLACLLTCLIARYHLLRFRFLLNCNSAILFLLWEMIKTVLLGSDDWEKHMHWAAAL
jgi:apolipoprotein N-acyltransferase